MHVPFKLWVICTVSLKDIALDNKTSPSLVRINIKQSKTDPFHKGFHLFLGCTGHHICPVKALLPYLAVRGSTEGPLFITEEGSPLTRRRFSTELSSILHAAGLETPTIILTVSRLVQPLQLNRLAYLTYIEKCWEDGRAMLMRLILERPDNS